MNNKREKFKIDLSNLETKNNRYDWENSIGKIIKFHNSRLSGELKIVNYIAASKSKIKAAMLILSYNDNILNEICINSLRNGNLGNILFDYIFKWEYDIGENLIDENKNITIIDRKYESGKQFYKIKCNYCGFDSSTHYFHDKGTIISKDEYWIELYHLKNLKKCPCCRINTKIVVPGINDITTTASWMIPYFQGGEEEAKLYTYRSSKKLNFKCIYCNRIKSNKISISDLYINHGINCACNDNMSFPNRFIYFLCEQLKEYLDYFENEYSPEWAGRYRYDMYLIYKGIKYIIEMDGELGHGNRKFKSQQKDVEGIKRDKIKNNLAIKNNINLIRIDCKISNFNYIKSNIINTLSGILPIEYIDWDLLEINCYKNINRDICDYYNKVNNDLNLTIKHFNLKKYFILNSLRLGKKLGWCNYITLEEKITKNKELVKNIKLNNIEYTSYDISKITGIAPTIVNNYLKSLELFDAEYSERVRKEKLKNFCIKTKSKIVYVYNLNHEYIGTYSSISELSRKSENDFGVKLSIQGISRVCTGERKQYKGFIFSYIKL